MSFHWNLASLPEIHAAIWKNWHAAARSFDDPLRLAVLATRSRTGVSQRTLVLRDCDATARTITSYTNVRSLKVQEIAADRRVSWLFYDPTAKIQIRVEGIIEVHLDDELAMRRWSQAPAASKLNYLGLLPPGTALNAAASNLPVDILEAIERGADNGELTSSFLEAGRKHFCVLVTAVNEIDWLWIKEADHRRCRFAYDANSEKFHGTWIAP